jgi:CTP:molybdopterin cytidylyltransferase MocA/HD superfamily phosphodiesterase
MTSPRDIAALILAAGLSRRMGTPKSLLSLGSETVLERLVNLFANAGIPEIHVVTGHLAETLRRRLPDLPVKWSHNEAYHRGMFSSVKKGVAALQPERRWFFLLPVDIPLVRPGTLATLLEACRKADGGTTILHPVFGGRRGHPPLIATRLIPDTLAWNGPGGLGGFLTGRGSDAAEIPVIDAFIHRDMDTPADYRSLSDALGRRHIPTAAECEAMLSDPSLFSGATAAHCRRVAQLAVYLAKVLAGSDVPLDIGCVEAAALLHDIAKGEKHHGAAGARKLTDMGFSGVADIVSVHMDIDVSTASSPTEAEVVYLADKLVRGDVLVPLAVRFEHKLAKYGHDPSARTAILNRRADAEAIVRRMEQAVGTSFQEIMDGFSKDPE